MNSFPTRKHKSVAALTARQYREAKKKELQVLKSEVISLREAVDYYKALYLQKEKELMTLKERCAHLEETAKSSVAPLDNLQMISVPSISSLSPEMAFDIESEPYVDNILDPVLTSLH